ncbi:hypothetical protein GCM10020001_119550 [Nonomuraea salmonea]
MEDQGHPGPGLGEQADAEDGDLDHVAEQAVENHGRQRVQDGDRQRDGGDERPGDDGEPLARSEGGR